MVILNFTDLDIERLPTDNIDVTLSYVRDTEWILTVHFHKEYSSCDKHIKSAVIKTSASQVTKQTISCNHGIACAGAVKLNHLNVCKPLALQIGLVYSAKLEDHIIWFSKSIPSVREEVDSTRTSLYHLEATSTKNESSIEFSWDNPVCLNRTISGWTMEFRHANSKLNLAVNIPFDCSGSKPGNAKEKHHHLVLKAGQLFCHITPIKYNVTLAPCSDYSLVLTPVVERMDNHELIEHAQSVNFTTPFDPSRKLSLVASSPFF